ncbi:MAG: LuxR C-terminal-related transcriptional regulator [Thermomicrobiales bacterium]
MNASIRVLLVDDQVLLRQGIRALLAAAPDISVVGEATTSEEAQRLSVALNPDVLLIGPGLATVTARSLLAWLRDNQPATRVLLLLWPVSAAWFRDVVALGAAGGLRTSDSPAMLIQALRAAHQGSLYCSAALQPLLTRRTPDVAVMLTPRERDVLALLAAGERNAAIAATLGIAVRTVDFHVRNLLGKFAARSCTEAVYRAREAGLLPPTAGEHGAAR